MSTHTNKTIQQICDEDTGDSSLITNLVRRGKELEEQLRIANKIINDTLDALPVGNIRTHTPESIPDRVDYYVKEYALSEFKCEALVAAGDSIIAEYYDPATQRKRGCIDKWEEAKKL